MSKLILAGLICVFSLSAFGQGVLIFQNSSTTTITNTCTGLPAEGGPAQDDTQVGLYIGNVGDSVGSLTLIAVTNCNNPGRFAGGTRTLAGWNPGTVQLQVRAWLATTVYPSYEAALAGALGGDISVMIGVSAPFTFTLVDVSTPPNSIANGGLTQFNIGRLTCVPEPSTFALGLLGLGLLFMCRRKK